MMTRYYQFAGVKIALSMPEGLIFEDEFHLASFRSEETEPDWAFRFEKTEELLSPEGKLVSHDPSRLIYVGTGYCTRYIGAFGGKWKNASSRVKYSERQVSVQLRSKWFSKRIDANYVLTCLGVEHLVARNHGFVFHCAFIEHDGKAILFTAPSGTGKSTQADLWNELRGAKIVNGDRAAVRLVDGTLLAEGIPFAGSSPFCENRSLPLEAIIYLSQAPETKIRKVTGYETFSKIWEGISVDIWDKKDLEMVSLVVQKAAETIPVYHLACTPDESAVIALEEALRKLVTL